MMIKKIVFFSELGFMDVVPFGAELFVLSVLRGVDMEMSEKRYTKASNI